MKNRAIFCLVMGAVFLLIGCLVTVSAVPIFELIVSFECFCAIILYQTAKWVW